MSHDVLIRCDYFDGSGAGHLKRCSVLADALEVEGFRSRLLLDEDRLDARLPVPVTVSVEGVATGLTPSSRGDAAHVVARARETGARIVVVDSYRWGTDWFDVVQQAGLKIIALDDRGCAGQAEISVNYAPDARPPADAGPGHRFLGGPKFLITDSPDLRQTVRTATPRTVMAHAGGTDLYRNAVPLYRVLGDAARELGLVVNWLCSTSSTAKILRADGLARPGDVFRSWTNESGPLWSEYDIVVGPTSTSLYEAILQGCLPLSFSLAENQTSALATWARIGHVIHLDNVAKAEEGEPVSLLELAVQEYATFRRALARFGRDMDGHGAARIARAVRELTNSGTATPDPPPSRGQPGIRPCDLRDAPAWRDARNSSQVRALSTHPEHVVRWSEHLRWWLRSDIERFVLEDEDGPQAFFWHRSCQVGSRNYLIGGWFPIGDKPAFAAAVQLLEWQLQTGAEHFPDHIWLATIHTANRAVLSLNRRYGFVEADESSREAARILFPGTNHEFVVLQKKANP